MAELSVKEIRQLQYEAQISLLNMINNEAEKFVYYEEKLDKNLLDGEKFRKRINEIGKGLQSNFYPPFVGNAT